MLILLRRKTLRRVAVTLLVCLVIALGTVAAPRWAAQDSLKVAVPATLRPVAEAIATGFLAGNPCATVTILEGCESDVVRMIRAGRADCGLVRRPVDRHGWLHTQAGWETAVLVTNPFNPVDDIPLSAVAALFRGTLRDWGGVARGGSGRVETVWAAENPAATLVSEAVVKAKGFLRPAATVRTTADLRREALARPGFLSAIPVEELGPAFKPLRVGGVYPDDKAVAGGAYPLARPVYLIRPETSRREMSRGRRGSDALASYVEKRTARAAEASVTLALGGDLLLDGTPGETVKAKGADYPLGPVASLLSGAELAFANLECPLGETGWRINTYRGSRDAVKVLTISGLDAVSLANDHILDYDDPALSETLAILAEAKVANAGAGHELGAARRPAILRAGGVRVGLLAYGDPSFCGSTSGRRWEASPWGSGIAPLRVEYMCEDIKALRKSVDVVVVSVHWGREGAGEPEAWQRRLAHQVIAAGADVVFGHHSHTLQGVEFFGRGVVFYSLGDLLGEKRAPGEVSGALARVNLTTRGVRSAELIPLGSLEGRTVRLDGERRAVALRQVSEASARVLALPLTPSAPPPQAPPAPPTPLEPPPRSG